MCSINVYIQLYELLRGNTVLMHSLILIFLQRSGFYQHSVEERNIKHVSSVGFKMG